jgi:hypothetical protein
VKVALAVGLGALSLAVGAPPAAAQSITFSGGVLTYDDVSGFLSVRCAFEHGSIVEPSPTPPVPCSAVTKLVINGSSAGAQIVTSGVAPAQGFTSLWTLPTRVAARLRLSP